MKEWIEKAWDDRSLLQNTEVQQAIRDTVEALDAGTLRVAEKIGGTWEVHAWIKKAVILYFPIAKMETMELPPFEFHGQDPTEKALCGKRRSRGAAWYRSLWQLCR